MELFRLAMRFADQALTLGQDKQSRRDLAETVRLELSFEIDDDDIAEMCEEVSGQ